MTTYTAYLVMTGLTAAANAAAAAADNSAQCRTVARVVGVRLSSIAEDGRG
jgi:hypothetical protein